MPKKILLRVTSERNGIYEDDNGNHYRDMELEDPEKCAVCGNIGSIGYTCSESQEFICSDCAEVKNA